MVTKEFDSFNQTIGQCDWYSFPHEIQQMFLIVLTNTQQSTFIQGFGNISCTRELFKRVSMFFVFFIKIYFDIVNLIDLFVFQTIYGSYSYFMVLRQMDG